MKLRVFAYGRPAVVEPEFFRAPGWVGDPQEACAFVIEGATFACLDLLCHEHARKLR